MAFNQFLSRAILTPKSVQVKYPLPRYHEPAPAEISNRLDSGAPLRKALQELLQRHSIQPRDIHLIYQSKPGYSRGGDKRVLAIHFDVEVPEGATTEMWSPVKRAIESLLSELFLFQVSPVFEFTKVT